MESTARMNGQLEAPASKQARKSRKQPREAGAPSKSTRQRTEAARKAERWARIYTGTAVLASSGLNGYAAAVAGPNVYAGAVLGGLVPVLVWLLATVTAWTYRAGWRRWALVPGAVAAVLLVLSVAHVAHAFAALTGTWWVLSVCLAVGIDAGLVASEATAILVNDE